MTKVKIQTTAGKILQKVVMDKLQKAKQIQANVILLIQPDISQYPKQKLLEDKVYRYHHNNYSHTAKPLQRFELIIAFGLNDVGR